MKSATRYDPNRPPVLGNPAAHYDEGGHPQSEPSGRRVPRKGETRAGEERHGDVLSARYAITQMHSNLYQRLSIISDNGDDGDS